MNETIVCPMCRKETSKYAPACTHCYGALKREAVPPAASPVSQPAVDAVSPPSLPKAQPDKKKSNAIVWIVVGLVFLVAVALAGALLFKEKPAQQTTVAQPKSEKVAQEPAPASTAPAPTTPALPVVARKPVDIDIETTVDSNVRAGVPFTVEVTIKGTLGSVEKPRFVPSGSGDVKLLELNSSPNTVGGRSEVFRAKLVANGAGKLNVGVFQFTIDGKVFKTPQIQVELR